MKSKTAYKKYVEIIKLEEFISIYTSSSPEELFSGSELGAFSFPGNARSLAGRYLIKKTICNFLHKPGSMNEIEILNNSFGKPEIVASAELQKTIKHAGISNICCSISHSRNLITGMTIISF